MPTCRPRKSCPHSHIGSHPGSPGSQALIKPWKWYHNEEESAKINIDFSDGTLLAFKIVEDNQRLILRFWNVLNRATRGSLKPSPGPPQADFAGVKTAAAELRKWLPRQEPWINFSTQRFCKVFQTKSLRVFV